ncbi:MAG: sulfotransferase domain-containing protein [bacterium]
MKLANKYFIDYGDKIENTIFISSMGRSGSTWLSEIINYRNEYREIFEPINSKMVPEFKNYKYIQYFRPDDKRTELVKPVKDLFTGKIRNLWSDKFNKKLISNKRIIKDIRTNLLLGWMEKQFPNLPIILLFRHPLAVASSWREKGWGKEIKGDKRDLDIILSQKEIIKDYLQPYLDDIKESFGTFYEFIYLWCILYFIPLRQLKKKNVHLVFYENLCQDSDNEISRLFKYLKKPFDPKIKNVMKKPSAMTGENSALNTGSDLVSGWREHVADDEIEKSVQILKSFGLDNIYSTDSMPSKETIIKYSE